jgi:hypothetical protein
MAEQETEYNFSVDSFDWGFTAVNEEELGAVSEAKSEVEGVEAAYAELHSINCTLEKRCDSLYHAIQPLLTNLKSNPEKDYIWWPDRLEKVEQFEVFLKKIHTPSTSTN